MKTRYKIAGITKDVDLKKRKVTGVLNTYNYLDSDGDVIRMGSAKDSILSNGPDSGRGNKIKFLRDHMYSRVIGKFDLLEERTYTLRGEKAEGLYFEGTLADTPLGEDTLKLIQMDALDAYSISFVPLEEVRHKKGAEGYDKALESVINPKEADRWGYITEYKKIKLYEASVVAIGANDMTGTLESKGIMELSARIKVLEDLIRGAGLSDETCKVLEQEAKRVQCDIDKTKAPLEKDEKENLIYSQDEPVRSVWHWSVLA